MSKFLPIPDKVQMDPNAVELMRMWAASGQQHVSIATGVWENPAAWGIALVDLASHIARAYERDGADRRRVLDLIKRAFDAEWESPTE
jgi:uncharacterized protein DUF5076